MGTINFMGGQSTNLHSSDKCITHYFSDIHPGKFCKRFIDFFEIKKFSGPTVQFINSFNNLLKEVLYSEISKLTVELDRLKKIRDQPVVM